MSDFKTKNKTNHGCYFLQTKEEEDHPDSWRMQEASKYILLVWDNQHQQLDRNFVQVKICKHNIETENPLQCRQTITGLIPGN